MKILIVDDSKAMRMIVKRTLRQAGISGHEVVEAENGKDALEMIESEAPDLVLSDWNMPVMTGLELLKALKELGKDLHFGFVTSERTPEMRKLAEENGAEFLIGKPFTPERFQEVLNPILA